jgi:hypothetical protein
MDSMVSGLASDLKVGRLAAYGTGNDLLNNPEVKSAYLAGGQTHAA